MFLLKKQFLSFWMLFLKFVPFYVTFFRLFFLDFPLKSSILR